MKGLKLNVLALFAVAFGFLYNAFIGRVFGITRELDIYFATYTLITYAGIFSQIFYECFITYYADMRIKSREESDRLYSTLINQTTLFTILIILILNLSARPLAVYFLSEPGAVNLVRIMSLFMVLQNLYIINKGILAMNFKFAASYICDILIFIAGFFFILITGKKWGVFTLAYSLLLSYAFALAAQYFIIFFILKLRYYLQFRHATTLDILKGSIMVKAGAVLYGLKDVIIGNILVGAGTGVYSTYSYANKFASAVNSVINAPSISVFTSEVNFMVSGKETAGLLKKIRSVLVKMLLLFSLCAAAAYIVIPWFVRYFMKVSPGQAVAIPSVFILLCLYFLAMTIDAPFSRTVSAFKKFGLVFITNAIFFMVFLAVITLTPHTAVFAVISLIVAQLSNVTLYIVFVLKTIRKERGKV